MKWLTIKQIECMSETAKGALEASYEHWNQLYTATQKELRQAYDEQKIHVTQQDCGLCIRYFKDNCRGCPLRDCEPERALYRKARNALDDWLDDDGKWKDWKRTSKAVRDKLKKLLDKSK